MIPIITFFSQEWGIFAIATVSGLNIVRDAVGGLTDYLRTNPSVLDSAILVASRKVSIIALFSIVGLVESIPTIARISDADRRLSNVPCAGIAGILHALSVTAINVGCIVNPRIITLLSCISDSVSTQVS